MSNPTEILKCAQKFILQGRPLGVTSLSQALDGETNFVCIDRYQVLKSAKEELMTLKIQGSLLKSPSMERLPMMQGVPGKNCFVCACKK